MTDHDQRDKLFDRAKYGEITGAEADAEAIRLGFGSLSSNPDPDTFRPETEAHWTLPMSVAWIATRDLEEVREWSEPFRAASYHWVWRRWRVGFDGPVYEGWHLDQKSRPTLALLSLAEAYHKAEGGKPSLPIPQAREALWNALRERFLVASGIDSATNRRAEIPDIEWHDLVAIESKGEVDEVRRGSLGTGYREVLVPSVALRRLWPKPPPNYKVALPPLVRPEGDGYMPLACAAQWIASEGGTNDFDPEDKEIWRLAFDKLLGAIASEKARVVGLRNGAREIVAGFNFAGIVVDYPFSQASIETTLGTAIYLRSYPYIDEQHWRGGFDDALLSRQREHWTQLQVEKHDIWTLWPFTAIEPERSGAPGKPTSMHLVVAELERRAVSGEMLDSIVAESRALSAWLATNHAKKPQAKPKAVETGIRERYWGLRGRK